MTEWELGLISLPYISVLPQSLAQWCFLVLWLVGLQRGQGQWTRALSWSPPHTPMRTFADPDLLAALEEWWGEGDEGSMEQTS